MFITIFAGDSSEDQQAQQLAMNPPRSAGDGRQEIQLAMVPTELPEKKKREESYSFFFFIFPGRARV